MAAPDSRRPGAPASPEPRRTASSILFDLRTIIGVLFAVYGAVCLVVGLVSFTGADSRRAAGVNVNLWTGIAMLVISALFIGWCWWRPVVAAEPDAAAADDHDGDGDGDERDG